MSTEAKKPQAVENIEVAADLPVWAKLVVLSYYLREAEGLLNEVLRGDPFELSCLTGINWEEWSRFADDLRKHLPYHQRNFYSTFGGAR